MPFVPSDISGLQLRLETAGLVLSDGSVPASWTDSTPNAIVAANHNVAYRTGEFYGHPGFECNGVDSYFDLGTPAALEIYDALTIFAVVKTSTPGRSFVLAKDLGIAYKGYGLGISPDGAFYMDFASNVWDAPSGPSLIDNAPHILRMSFSSSAVSWKPAVDGVQLFDFGWGAAQVHPEEPWNIGRCARVGDSEYFAGSIAAILIYDSVLSPADILRVETYLFDTYVPPPAVPIPYTVQIGPSGEDVIVRYRMLDGVTPGKVIGTAGGLVLHVNGVDIPLTDLAWCSNTADNSNDWLFGPIGPTKYSATIDNESVSGFATPSGTWANVPSILQDGVNGKYFHNTISGLTFTQSNSAGAAATYTFSGLLPGPGLLMHFLWDLIDTDRTIDAVYTARDGSGTLLGVSHLDQTAVIGPDNFDLKFADRNCKILLEYDLAAGQDTIVVTVTNGAGSGYLICDALVVKSKPVPIAVPGDTVTIDIPANSVTVSGLANPRDVIGRAVTFATDNDIAPFDPARPRTMIAGYNKEPSGTNGLALMAADRGFSIGGWSGDGFGGTVAIDQATGEIISMTGVIGAKLWDTLGDIGSGIPIVNDGDSFRIEFDYTAGTFDATAKSGQTFSCENNASVTKNPVGPLSDGYENLGGTRWRLTATYHTAPWLPLSTRAPYFFENYGVTRGTWFAINSPVHNISFFDRYTPIGDTRYAHPTLHDRFGGTGMMWRFMDALATNVLPVSGVSDYWPEAAHWRSPSPKAALRPVITKVRGFVRDDVADPDHVLDWFVNGPFFAVVVIEVDSTAGIADGLDVSLDPVPPDFPCSNPANTAAPTVHVENGTVFVISPTAVLFLVGYGSGNDGTMPTSILNGADWVPSPGTATLWSYHGTDSPVILAKCAAEVGMLPYFTLPYLLTDDGAVEFAQMAMDHFPSGTKIRFEFFNEVWNSVIVEEAWGRQVIHLNRQHDADPIAQPLTFRTIYDIYIWKSNHFRQVMLAEFAAAGRASDLVWIVGGLAADGGITGNIASWGASQSPPVAVDFDEFAIDTYQDLAAAPFAIATNAPGGLAAVCDRLGVGGSIDLLSLCAVAGSRESLTNGHRSILDSFGFNHVKIVSYEGGWNALVGQGTTAAENTSSQWAQVILRHPRMYHLTLAYLQYLDRLGYGFFCRYSADGTGGLGRLAWCDYSTPAQANGTGSPSENANPWDVGSLVSQEGGAMRTWASRSLSPTLASVTPSGELLWARFDGGGVTAVSDGASLTINGSPMSLSDPLFDASSDSVAYPLGLAKYASFVDDDSATLSGGTWTRRTPGNFNSKSAVNSAYRTSPDAGATAVYHFTGMTPGVHRVSVLLWDLVGPDRTQNAVYTVRDGSSNVLATFTINQQAQLYPRFDREWAGYDLTDLGTFTLASGQTGVTVTLTKGGGSGVLVADAVLVRSLPASPVTLGDTVTFACPAGTVTVGGDPNAAIVDLPVVTLTDADFLLFDLNHTRILKCGYNKAVAGPGSIALVHADRALDLWPWEAESGATLTLDAAGKDIVSLSGTARKALCLAVTDSLDGRGVLSFPDGSVLRLEFDAAADAAAVASAISASVGGSGTASLSQPVNIGGNRWRVYLTVNWQAWSPISARSSAFSATWSQDVYLRVTDMIVTNLSVYDNRTPIDYPLATHPTVVDRLNGRGLGPLRLKDVMAIDGSTAVTAADLDQQHLTDMVKMCVECGMSPWVHVPHQAHDDLVALIADIALSVTKGGMPVYVAYSNEVWLSSPQRNYIDAMMASMNSAHASDPTNNPYVFADRYEWYCYRSWQCRTIFRSRAVAAKRDPSDVVWVMESSLADTSVTHGIAHWGGSQSPAVAVQFERLSLDSHRDGFAGTDAAIDRLGQGGILDLLAISSLHDIRTASHLAILGDATVTGTNSYGEVAISSHAGGWRTVVSHGTVDAHASLSQAVALDPRMRKLTLAEIQVLDLAGYRERCRSSLDDTVGASGASVACDFTTVYGGVGTGDPSENPSPLYRPGVVSQSGAAVRDWGRGAPPESTRMQPLRRWPI